MKIFHLVGLLVLSPSAGLGQDMTPDVRVPYRDLNLQSRTGVATLNRRLKEAIRAVCPDADGSANLTLRVAAEHCVQAKIAEVAPQRDRVLAGGPALPTTVAGAR